MARKMLLLTADGSSPVLQEIAAHDELQLQKRLTENPDLIPIEEFGWRGPLMVIGRETSLPSGSVDLIGIARSGEILVAEFKTGPQNPDFRHALAQALDYGADIWGMSFDEFDAAVAARYFSGPHCPPNAATWNSKSILEAAQKFWGPDWSDEEQSEFRQKTHAALEDGNIHYAVIAQRFTPAMETTASYLNTISATAAFYLVELIRFSNGSIDAYEARTILKPDRTKHKSASAGTSLNQGTFLSLELDDDRRARLEDFFEFCTGMGLVIFWGTAGVSIKIATAESTPLSIGWVHPSGVTGWMGLSDTALGYDHASAAQHPLLAAALANYVGDLGALPGVTAAKAKNLNACVFHGEAEAQNHSQIKELLAALVEAVASL